MSSLSSSAFAHGFSLQKDGCYFCSGGVNHSCHHMNFIHSAGRVFSFCKSKCHNNLRKKHNPHNIGWTKTFHRAAGKEFTGGNSFEFEKRRNIVYIYHNIETNTSESCGIKLDAMKRVEEIEHEHQAKCMMNRLQKNKELQKFQDIKAVKQSIPSEALLQAKESIRKTKWYRNYKRMWAWKIFRKSYCL